MNVTKVNFAEAAEQLEALLPSAAFVAIDEEMTGITLPGQTEMIDDIPASRYSKLRNVASRYNIIQFGVCLFHAGAEKQFVARPFNFYLFPEAGAVNMEGSSIKFLCDHKMDFNKWIYEGIPYLSNPAAEKLHASLFPQDAAEKRTPLVLNKQSDIDMTDTALAGLQAWLEDETKKEEMEYEIMKTNPYIRRYLYGVIAERYPQLIAESRQVPGVRGQAAFVVLRLSNAQKVERDDTIRVKKEQEYAEKVGFLRVFNALAKAKKPLIGHNCMCDLLFMLSHFEGTLPESYIKFKEAFQNSFALLFDTKLLATQEPFKFAPQISSDTPDAADKPECKQTEQRFGSTALGEVFKVFRDEAAATIAKGETTIEVSFAPGFERYAGDDSAAAHEAAYDAYMTGYAFAHMAVQGALTDECITAFGNRTPMFRSLFDFNLAGVDSRIHDGVYVHVSGLKGRTTNHVREAFQEIKTSGSEPQVVRVDVRWINDDSAFAVLPHAYASDVEAFLGRVRFVGGLTFIPGEEWFAARNAAWLGANGIGGKEAAREESAPKRPRVA